VVSDRTRIERLLKRYYGDVKNGNYDAAWALLTPSYKKWKKTHGGRSKWHSQELLDYQNLDPSGMKVSIFSRDGSGVDTIYVSGMHYGSKRCDYVGYTWVRKVGGTWLYDQGYLQDATRAATWQRRQTETLGFVCENNGY
jgi:hypothetical protein